MSDAGRPPGRPPDGATWPPPVPTGIHLRPRSAASPAGAAEPAAPGLPPAPQAPPGVASCPAPAATFTLLAPALPAVPGSAPLAPAAQSAAPPADAPLVGATLLDPFGYRLRLVRDAAAALAVLVGAVLVGSLLAGPAPTGDVLSATGAPDAAADPRGSPGLLLPGAAGPGVGSTPIPTPAPSGAPGASSDPPRSASPEPRASGAAAPVP